MMSTNNKLMQKVDSLASASLEDKAVEAGVAEGETTHALLDKWGTLNLARALIVGVAAVCAVWAALDKEEYAGVRNFALQSGANRLG